MTVDSTTDLDAMRTIGTPIDGHVPDVPPAQAWDDRRLHYNLVSPTNRRKFTVIVVGTGLAGAGAAAALGELGFNEAAHRIHDQSLARFDERRRCASQWSQRVGRVGHLDDLDVVAASAERGP